MMIYVFSCPRGHLNLMLLDQKPRFCQGFFTLGGNCKASIFTYEGILKMEEEPWRKPMKEEQ